MQVGKGVSLGLDALHTIHSFFFGDNKQFARVITLLIKIYSLEFLLH